MIGALRVKSSEKDDLFVNSDLGVEHTDLTQSELTNKISVAI